MFSIPEGLRGALHVTAEELGVQGPQGQGCLQDSLGKCSLQGDDSPLLPVSVFTEMFDDQKTGVAGAAAEVVGRLLCPLISSIEPLYLFLWNPVCQDLPNPACLPAFTGHSGTLFEEAPWWVKGSEIAGSNAFLVLLPFLLTDSWGLFRDTESSASSRLFSFWLALLTNPCLLCEDGGTKGGNRFSLLSGRNFNYPQFNFEVFRGQLMLCWPSEYWLDF